MAMARFNAALAIGLIVAAIVIGIADGQAVTYCEEEVDMSGESGTIVDHTGPEGSLYAIDRFCRWNVYLPPASTHDYITLQFDAFDVENFFDTVVIYDDAVAENATILAELTGHDLVENTFVTTSTSFRVEFSSDPFVPRTGFTLNWWGSSCLNRCTGHGVCSTDDTDLCVCDAPYFGDDCSSFPGNCTGGCANGGSCVDGVCECTGGWHGETCEDPYCEWGHELTATSGEIFDHAHGSEVTRYEAGANCSWVIRPPSTGASRTITLSFTTFNLIEASVTVYDGETNADGTRVAQYSDLGPSVLPPPAVSHSGAMYVTFIAGASVSTGFNADYTVVDCSTSCSGHGHCVSADTCHCQHGWGGPDCADTICEHECYNEGNMTGNACSVDGSVCECVDPYSGLDCGQCNVTAAALLPDVVTEVNITDTVCVNVTTAMNATMACNCTGTNDTMSSCNCTTSFNATSLECSEVVVNTTSVVTPAYVSPICAGKCEGTAEFNAPVGKISTGPGDYRPDAACVFVIDAGDAYSAIALTFEAFDLDVDASVAIYDSRAPLSNRRMGYYVGDALPPVVISSSPQLLVVFESTSNLSIGTGFDASYTALSCPSDCSNHGACVEEGVCRCDVGFDGPSCNTTVCVGTCNAAALPGTSSAVNGSYPNANLCAGDRCSCGAGFFGVDCEQQFCSGVKEIRASSGVISDHSAGPRYEGNADCEWVIWTESTSGISISWPRFQMEWQFDYVFLYTFVDDPADRTLFAVYSGEFAPAAQTWDGVTNLIVRFESDYSVELGGFEFEWFSLDLCPDNCSGNGNCIEGTCFCQDGYGGANCSVPGGADVFDMRVLPNVTFDLVLNQWVYFSFEVPSDYSTVEVTLRTERRPDESAQYLLARRDGFPSLEDYDTFGLSDGDWIEISMRRPLPGVWYFGLVGFADAPALFTEVDAVFAHGVCIPPIYGLFPPCACSPNWGGFECTEAYCDPFASIGDSVEPIGCGDVDAGDTCTLACEYGFSPVGGEVEIECIGPGEWDPAIVEPVCAVNCEARNFCSGHGACEADGGDGYCRCLDGWGGNDCATITCPPYAPADGVVNACGSAPVETGNTCQLACAVGLAGESTVVTCATAGDEGVWMGDEPTCIAGCQFTLYDNMASECADGQVYPNEFSCAIGCAEDLFGDEETRTCVGGVWRGSYPICSEDASIVAGDGSETGGVSSGLVTVFIILGGAVIVAIIVVAVIAVKKRQRRNSPVLLADVARRRRHRRDDAELGSMTDTDESDGADAAASRDGSRSHSSDGPARSDRSGDGNRSGRGAAAAAAAASGGGGSGAEAKRREASAKKGTRDEPRRRHRSITSSESNGAEPKRRATGAPANSETLGEAAGDAAKTAEATSTTTAGRRTTATTSRNPFDNIDGDNDGGSRI